MMETVSKDNVRLNKERIRNYIKASLTKNESSNN